MGISAIESSEDIKIVYRHQIARRILLLAFCIAAMILFIGMFSLAEYDSISISETYKIIWNHLMGTTYDVHSEDITERRYFWADRFIWNTIMPHICAAILAGGGLAVCGALMQAIMNNPLADPYSTGISSGAAFGAVAAIISGISISTVEGEMGIVTNAFVGAMIPAVIVIILSQRINMTPATLILLGTAVSYFFNSLTTYVMVTADADTLKSAYLWQVGSLDSIDWNGTYVMAAVTIVGSIIVLLLSNILNVMSLGDNSAKSLGIDVHKFRIICLTLMAVMTAAIVSFTGILGFIGLVSPHIVRLVIGSDNKFVIPVSIVVGSFLLLLSDYLAFQLSDIPVGVILSIIGSPVFFLLIVFQGRRTGAIY
ncbi:iron ABC transporter permease [Methanomassiliicoccales archaeon LGM-DZ1]|nr:iron ABC transporter permease [Methanomassiliicoccales archaeon LGM-DZ1]